MTIPDPADLLRAPLDPVRLHGDLTFRWATVESTYPLRIRFDGDSQAVPITPDSLIDRPPVNARVWVQIFNRRLIILGTSAESAEAFGYTLPTLIGTWQRYSAWPQICQAADGSLVVAHGSGAGHTPEYQMGMVFWRSTDGGRTWDRRRTYEENGQHLSTFCLGMAPDYTLFCLARKQSNSNSAVRSLQVWRSVDNGASWSLDSTFTPPQRTLSVFSPVNTDDGNIVAAYTTNTGAEAQSAYHSWGLMRSGDDGRTWEQQEVARMSTGFTGEIRLWKATDGALLALGRHDNVEGNGVWQSWSFDNGRAWTEWVRGGVTDAYQTPVAPIGSTDTIYCYYLDRLTGRIKVRTASSRILRSNPGAWSEPYTIFDKIYSGSIYDTGYLDAVETEEGDHHLTWYAGFKNPQIWHLVGSRSPSHLERHNPVEVLDRITFGPNDIVSTNTGNPGQYVGSIAMPRDFITAAGRLYVRIQGNTRLSVVGQVTIRLNSNDETVQTLVLPHNVAGSYAAIDSGWVEAPANFLQGSSQDDFGLSSLTLYAQASGGEMRVLPKTRALIGVRR